MDTYQGGLRGQNALAAEDERGGSQGDHHRWGDVATLNMNVPQSVKSALFQNARSAVQGVVRVEK